MPEQAQVEPPQEENIFSLGSAEPQPVVATQPATQPMPVVVQQPEVVSQPVVVSQPETVVIKPPEVA